MADQVKDLASSLASVCSTLSVCQYALEQVTPQQNDLLRPVYFTLLPARTALLEVVDAEDNRNAGSVLYRAQALFHVALQALDADDTDPGYVAETLAVLRETIEQARRRLKVADPPRKPTREQHPKPDNVVALKSV